jgi:hypothetical protein
VYARRYTDYRDPLDGILQQWMERLADITAEKVRPEIEEMAKDVKRHDARIAEHGVQIEEVKARVTQAIKGILRVAAGHPPFEEGFLPKPPVDDPDTKPA